MLFELVIIYLAQSSYSGTKVCGMPFDNTKLVHANNYILRFQSVSAGLGAVVRSSPLVPIGPGFESASLHCTLQG